MAYRDELEALRARVAALEAERDAARAQAERLEHLLHARPLTRERTPELVRRADPPWRSLPGGQPTPVTIVNESGRKLEVFWLSYEGRERSAGTVVPGGRIRAQTNVGHCWRIVDADTRQVLLHTYVRAGEAEPMITYRSE